ncbi:MAG: aromatic ring-hydroxylating dioxygenase subunit alpha [Nitrospirae bacterium]|nr:aromatic ring-hydroxylating dioxygenase subunit alpha [Nitrospirota bacterium]
MSFNQVSRVLSPLSTVDVPDLRKTNIHPDYWFPVAQSRDVKRKKTLGVLFAGSPIVLVRTESGGIFALEDRCAHRQVPLHDGVVLGEEIQCGYHCWRYDHTGRCISVPYLDKNKSLPLGVKSYPCREAYGFIFVFPGDLSALPDSVFPEVPTFADSHYKTRYLDRQIACHYSFMHENLMDMNHQFLHRRYMGRIKTVFRGLREGKNFVEVDYTFSRVGGKQPIGEKFIIGRQAPQEDGPEQDLMTIRTEYPYQTLKFWTAGSVQPALALWNVYVPVDHEQRRNHTFGLMMIRKPSLPGLIHVLWPFIVWFTDRIFAEDQWIVEKEQRAFDAQGADWNQEIFPVIQSVRNLLIQQGESLSEVPILDPDRRELPCLP